MKVSVTTLSVRNPATYLFNKYRAAATNHINCALDTIVINNGNSAAVMATANQLYEDLQQLLIIGLISEREYDAVAAVTFEVLCGDNQHFVLPEISCVKTITGESVYEFAECKTLVCAAIITPINKCIDFLVNTTEEDWKADGWETKEEYHQYLLKAVHNFMRLGKIIGATTEKDHDNVTMHMKQCVETNSFTEFSFGG